MLILSQMFNICEANEIQKKITQYWLKNEEIKGWMWRYRQCAVDFYRGNLS